MPTVNSTSEIRRSAATQWRLRQDDGLSPDEAAAFDAWLADPDNAAAYRRSDRVWAALDVAEADDLALLRRRVRAEVTKDNRRAGVRRFAGLAAALVAGLGGYGVYHTRSQGALYIAAAETPREVRLGDGSLVILDGGARVRARLSAGVRDIALLQGQARFDVAHDPARPFRVDVGSGVVQAVGTVFNIDRGADDATVTLVEGAIDVFVADGAKTAPRRLQAGEQIRLARGGDAVAASEPVVRKVDTETVTVWKTGRMRFYDVALQDAVARMNQTSDRPIVLEGEGVKALKVSGTFRYGDAEGFGQVAAEVLGLELSERPDGLVLKPPTR